MWLNRSWLTDLGVHLHDVPGPAAGDGLPGAGGGARGPPGGTATEVAGAAGPLLRRPRPPRLHQGHGAGRQSQGRQPPLLHTSTLLIKKGQHRNF